MHYARLAFFTPNQTEDGHACKIMPVCLYGMGEGGFTAELGLWVLCMMALIDEMSSRVNADGASDDIDVLMAQFRSVLGQVLGYAFYERRYGSCKSCACTVCTLFFLFGNTI